MPVIWRKTAAAFMLIWALMDMSVPGVCQNDDLESSPSNIQTVQPAKAITTATIQAFSSAPNDTPSDRSGPEDCFCCSYVTPTPVFSLPGQAILESYGHSDPLGHQLEYSTFFYHPPRS